MKDKFKGIKIADVNDGLSAMKEKADLMFADPPYNIGIKYGDAPRCEDKVAPRVFARRLQSWIESMFQSTRDGGVVALLISEEWANIAGSHMDRLGAKLNRVIWWETFANYRTAENGLTNEHRHLFIYRKWGAESTFNNDRSVRVMSARLAKYKDDRANPDGKVPGDVWIAPRLTGNHLWRVDWHKAQLHPAPLTRIVRLYTNPGDLVVDAFAGSGSLGVVCAVEGRRFEGVEKDRGTAERCRTRIRRAYKDPSSIPAVDMTVIGGMD